MIDIDQLSADDRTTHRVKISKDAGFVVIGPNSAEYHKAEAKMAASAIMAMRSGQGPDLDTEDGAMAAAAQSRDRALMVAELCTVDWYGFTSAGAEIPFTVDGLRSVLAKRPNWALTIAQAVEREGNFTKG